MKVIVAGSRAIRNYEDVAYAIARSGFHVEELVRGGAKGVDRLGEEWREPTTFLNGYSVLCGVRESAQA